jgi:PAS domain S-box-containing protein
MARKTTRFRSGGKSAAPKKSLRGRAEARVRASRRERLVKDPDELARLVHELRVHQAELEMQNEELRQAQMELARSRDRYTSLFESAPVGYLTLDAAGIIAEANQTIATMLGVEGDRLPGVRFSKFIARSSQDAIFLHLQSVFAGQTRKSAMVELGGRAAKAMTVELHSIARTDADRNRRDCFTTVIDISARLEVEHKLVEQTASLRESEGRLAGILASAMDAVVSVDQDRRIILFNAAAERMFGWKAAAIIGQPLDRLIPTGLRPAHRQHVRRFEQTGESNRKMGGATQLHGQRADGKVFPIEASISQVVTGGWRVFTAIVRDITASAQAAERLRESEQSLRELFNGAPIGIMWVGPDGCVIRVNRAMLDLLDRPLEEVLDQPVWNLHPDQTAVDTMLDLLARQQPVKDHRLLVTTKAGPLRHLLVDANGHWEEGRLVYSRWFVRDITNRVKLEGEILTIAEHERERIGHDLHDDLCQHLAAIEFQNESVVLAAEKVAPAVATAVREISAQLRKAIGLTRDFARSLSPHLHFQPDALMIGLKELAERTQRVFNLTCHFHCAKPVLVEDEAVSIHLYRIAQEAVRNAVKHAQATRIELRLAANEHELVLGVHDNGIGLPARPYPQTGLGLKIMQYRVGAIGGSIVIQNQPQGGTAIVCTARRALPNPTP